ncbi:MAG TPA: hypothetical protein VH299_13405 [Solirubrobacterales bacterium]|jgi:hypothetical protein|nr:hypothetical protein [Solirubrobacterales bacterium]
MDDLGSKVSYLVAQKGIPVYSSDEVKVGTVVEVLDAPEADLFDGIIFDTTHNRPGGHKFVDAPEVEGVYERGVILTIDAEAAAKLAAPQKNPGSIKISPDDVAGEAGPSFWRRTWNLLSGKG